MISDSRPKAKGQSQTDRRRWRWRWHFPNHKDPVRSKRPRFLSPGAGRRRFSYSCRPPYCGVLKMHALDAVARGAKSPGPTCISSGPSFSQSKGTALNHIRRAHKICEPRRWRNADTVEEHLSEPTFSSGSDFAACRYVIWLCVALGAS